jgi:hypothetical protein
MNLCRAIDTALEVVGADRLNRIVQVQNYHLGRLRRCHARCAWPEQAQQEQQNHHQQKERPVVMAIPER